MKMSGFFGRAIWGTIGLAVSTTQAVPERFAAVDIHTIDAFLHDQFSGKEFGIVVGLIDKGGTSVIKAGKLGDGSGRLVDGDTLFEIGSVTKTFTSLLLLNLAESGELKLETSVAECLPEVKVPEKNGVLITLEHLAAQESGLPFDASNHARGDWLNSYNSYSVENLYAFLEGHQLGKVPGKGFRYSNVGFSVLGHALERKTDSDFESLVVERICEPLEMKDTRIRLTAEQEERRAVGYDSKGKKAGFFRFQVMEAAGALYSSTNDLLKYVSAQLGYTESRLISSMKQSHAIRQRNVERWGRTAMPWFDSRVHQLQGMDFRGHAGTTFGMSSFVGFDLAKRRGVVVLTNQRFSENGRRWLSAPGIGWAILQGETLTPEHGRGFLRKHVGLGIALDADKESGEISIIRVVSESPAARAGLSAGWLLRKVGDVSLEGKTLLECVTLLGGIEGEVVKLELFSREEGKTQMIELKREKYFAIN